MSRNQIVALGAVVLIAAFLAALALRTRQPPVLPADEAHGRFVSEDECTACHGPDAVLPMSKNHPLRTDCMDCHGMP
jgi:mono/diheme cytochrome c family protein